jgi:DNA-binding transcriptional MerR regulator
MRELLTTAQVAERLSWVPIGTLRYWRHIGEGPPSVRIRGRVVYDADELDAWVETHFAEQS